MEKYLIRYISRDVASDGSEPAVDPLPMQVPDVSMEKGKAILQSSKARHSVYNMIKKNAPKISKPAVKLLPSQLQLHASTSVA